MLWVSLRWLSKHALLVLEWQIHAGLLACSSNNTKHYEYSFPYKPYMFPANSSESSLMVGAFSWLVSNGPTPLLGVHAVALVPAGLAEWFLRHLADTPIVSYELSGANRGLCLRDWMITVD